ncbi:M-phase inducer phosphatase-like [Ruditapes philippinarum]|uniref:M-phase inducer phosphatase-like n=1 Tax=Ruditapes philippinarum TaxID=129788 RepID=UPI00295A8714|nr:M-phase inducer phosphatase-like [Ruditapes philippinarum]
MALRLRLFETADESPMQTTSGDIWDEIEAVITPYGKDKQEADSDAEFSIKIPSRFSIRRQVSDARRSLFSGKRLADDSLEAESPATKKSKDCVSDSNNIIEAVERLESRELVADGSRSYTLPTIPGKHSDLKSISTETMADVVEGKYIEQLGNVTIVDCRYPYEFEGGHIRGAVNLYTKDAVNTLLQETSTSEKPRVLIFHCEFSSERGPKMYRFLRSQDREMNKDSYPHLNYPEIYLLDGGYKAFFYKFPELCDPISYKPMLHEDHAAELRHFRVKSKSWTAGEKQKTSRRSRSRLACYNLDF